MVVKKDIAATLKLLDDLYTAHAPPPMDLLYSKLAILELAGWVEISMDDIIARSAARCLKTQKSHSDINERIRGNWGFSYKKHFKNMVIRVVGLKGLEQVVKALGAGGVSQLKAELELLKDARDEHAHTPTTGVTPHYQAPSWTIARLERLYTGLKEFSKQLRRLKY